MELTLSNYQPLYENLKYWLPLISTIVLVWKGGKAVRTWADQLLNNHLHSIQQATQTTASVLKEVRDDGKRSIELTEKMRQELADARQAAAVTQEKIFGGLEALKFGVSARRRVK